jgi:hypothetical protein
MTILIEIFPWPKLSQTIRAEETMVPEQGYFINSVETPANTRAIINWRAKTKQCVHGLINHTHTKTKCHLKPYNISPQILYNNMSLRRHKTVEIIVILISFVVIGKSRIH